MHRDLVDLAARSARDCPAPCSSRAAAIAALRAIADNAASLSSKKEI